MRKTIAGILAASLLLTGTGCSSTPTAERSESESSGGGSSVLQETGVMESGAATENPGSSAVAESAAETPEESLEDAVEITLPAQYGEADMTQADCDALAAANHYISVTLNADGSLTYVMSGERHQQLMQDTADSIDTSLEGMCGSEAYPNIVSVTHNADYTEFTVLTASQALSLEETMSVMNFYLYGGMYQAMAGNPDTIIHVIYRNCDTNEILKETDSSELGTETGNGFLDVPADRYYAEAVAWALQNGIAYGTDETHFSPDEVCTRAQLLTMLWREAESPAPGSVEMPFTDISEADSQAILWAVEQGIAAGTSETEFSPEETVSRGQAVVFLWRYAGSPEPEQRESVFEDVEGGTETGSAVQWAVEQGIAAGTSETEFSPDEDCTRGQIVTFLYRDFDR